MSLPSLTSSLHEPYRARLDLLANDATLTPLISQIGAQRAWWAGNRTWARTYGRFFPGESPYGVMVFASAASEQQPQALCVVEAFEDAPPAQTDQAHCLRETAIGWLRLTCFPADARLPTIDAVLAEPGQPTVVRYRPNKRCTLRFDYGNGQAPVYVKVFPDAEGRRLYAEAEMLWQASCSGEIAVMVARALRWDADTCTLWQSQVPGRPALKTLFGRTGPHLAERLGRAAASLTTSRLKPHSTFGRQEQLQDTVKQGSELARRIPALRGAIHRLWDELRQLHHLAEDRTLAPIHAAPHPHQWLEDGERLGLVDFDGFTLGDPALDIATFMSEVDFENPLKMYCTAVNQAFLAGYEAVAGPVDQRLLAAYCAHKRLSKALKYAYAIRPDGDVRAEQALGRALMCVLQAPA